MRADGLQADHRSARTFGLAFYGNWRKTTGKYTCHHGASGMFKRAGVSTTSISGLVNGK